MGGAAQGRPLEKALAGIEPARPRHRRALVWGALRMFHVKPGDPRDGSGAPAQSPSPRRSPGPDDVSRETCLFNAGVHGRGLSPGVRNLGSQAGRGRGDVSRETSRTRGLRSPLPLGCERLSPTPFTRRAPAAARDNPSEQEPRTRPREAERSSCGADGPTSSPARLGTMFHVKHSPLRRSRGRSDPADGPLSSAASGKTWFLGVMFPVKHRRPHSAGGFRRSSRSPVIGVVRRKHGRPIRGASKSTDAWGALWSTSSFNVMFHVKQSSRPLASRMIPCRSEYDGGRVPRDAGAASPTSGGAGVRR